MSVSVTSAQHLQLFTPFLCVKQAVALANTLLLKKIYYISSWTKADRSYINNTEVSDADTHLLHTPN